VEEAFVRGYGRKRRGWRRARENIHRFRSSAGRGGELLLDMRRKAILY
jgi:hypothetical protein